MDFKVIEDRVTDLKRGKEGTIQIRLRNSLVYRPPVPESMVPATLTQE